MFSFHFSSSIVARYDDEPSFMKYIKIASTLHDKTVRDVALRCRWLTVSSFSLNSFSNLHFFLSPVMIPIQFPTIEDKFLNALKSLEYVVINYLKVEHVQLHFLFPMHSNFLV